MKLEYVREFLTLSETCNYLEAAEQLFLSQSTLSRHMQSLETELGVALLERTTRRVKLSDSGRLFLPYAVELVELEDACNKAILEELHQTTSVLTIGSIPSMSQYGITDIIGGFQQKMPQLTVDIQEADSNRLIQMVTDGSCDFAFVRANGEEHKELCALDYAEDCLAAILPLDHPLAQERTLSLDELRQEKFYLLPEDTLVHQMCMTACKKAGFAPKVAYTGYRGRNLINNVGRGNGVSILFKRSAAYYNHPNVAIVDIEPKYTMKIEVVYAKAHPLKAAQNSFLRYLKNNAENKIH